MADGGAQARHFEERPTQAVVPDAWRLGAAPLALGALCAAAGWGFASASLLLLAAFVVFFFRNPARDVPGDERTVVAPADGRVVEVSAIEQPGGDKALRIGIFLSLLDVHVNRAPLAGRVVAVERRGDRYLPAFRRRAETENARCTLTLETASGVRFRVAQITGWLARRVVCHLREGDWVERGARFGMIRFGSRTDVVLPVTARPRIGRGDRVRGGSSVLATLGEAS